MAGAFTVGSGLALLSDYAKAHLPIFIGVSVGVFVLAGLGLAFECRSEFRRNSVHSIPLNTFTVSCHDGIQTPFNIEALKEGHLQRDIIAPLQFRNGYQRPRTILGINFTYLKPGGKWEEGYDILHDSKDGMDLLGNSLIQINANSEQVTKHCASINKRYLETDGGQIGLLIYVIGADGVNHPTAFPVMTIEVSPNSWYYGYKRITNLSLDKPLSCLG